MVTSWTTPTVSRVVTLTGIVALTVALLVPPTSTAAQTTFGNYSVSARADLLLLRVFDDRIPLFPPGQPQVESSPATTQAAIDSLGSSTAFAAAPFPGETVVGLPGLIGGLGGGDLPPVPRLPVIVSSAHPTTERDAIDQGVYQLSATSDASSSRSVASIGAGEGEAFVVATGRAVTEVEASDDEVMAVSRVRAAGLVIPGVIELADLRSSASVSVDVDEQVTARTAFEIGVLSIGGVELSLTADGLEIADTLVPIDAAVLEGLVAAAGIELTFIPEEVGETDDGATFARSAGVLVEANIEGPDGENDRVVFEIGRTFATVDARPAPEVAFPDPPGDPGPPADPGEGFEPVDASEFDPAELPLDVGPPDDAAPVPPPEVAEDEPGQGLVAAPAAGPFHPGPTLLGFYLLLVVGGLVTVGSSRLVGELGVRLRGAPARAASS